MKIKEKGLERKVYPYFCSTDFPYIYNFIQTPSNRMNYNFMNKICNHKCLNKFLDYFKLRYIGETR